ncbi:MAG: SRPBCC family protein [Mycobacteriaceae bacterium]
MPHVFRDSTATPQQVWDVLADGWLFSSWVVGASRIRAVDATWPQPGARIHHSVGAWPALMNDSTHVTAAEPGLRLVLQARGWPVGEATVEITVAPTTTGSRITLDETGSAGVGRWMPSALEWVVVAPRNRESLKRLALLAEGRAA